MPQLLTINHIMKKIIKINSLQTNIVNVGRYYEGLNVVVFV